MKVVQFNTLDVKGGAARVAGNIACELGKNGVKVTTLVREKCGRSKNVLELDRPGYLEEIAVGMSQILDRDGRSAIKNWRKKYHNWRGNDVAGFDRREILEHDEYLQADVVQCHNLHGYYFPLEVLVDMAKEKPVVWTLHDMWAVTPFCAHSSSGQVDEDGFYACKEVDFPKTDVGKMEEMKRIKKRVYKEADFCVVSPSEWLAGKLEKSVLANKRIKVIPNGVDENVFKRKKIGKRDKKRVAVLAYGGKKNVWKNETAIDEVVDALGSDVELVNIGGSKQQSSKRVVETGFIEDQKKLAVWLGQCEVLLMPSRAENFPLASLEAMACEVPVVAYAVGGLPEQIDGGKTGFLVEKDDVDGLTKKVKLVLDKVELREKMGRRARAVVKQKFSLKQQARRYKQLYDELLAERDVDRI